MTNEQMNEYAELGARARLSQIQTEIDNLQAFMRHMDRMELPPVPSAVARRVGRPRKKKQGRPRAAVLVASPKRAARSKTATFLSWLGAHGITTGDEIRAQKGFNRIPLGVLTKNGYIEHTGNGYVRTPKPFTV